MAQSSTTRPSDITKKRRRIFTVNAAGKQFTMISMESIDEDEAQRFVSGKIQGAEIEKH